MVDFRYHLVSLISVFLALSVGVILGAGPLQNSLGQTLSGEVTDLRAANESLKAENDLLDTQVEKQGEAFNVIAPSLVSSSLEGRIIGIVRAPGVDDATVAAVTEKLKLAGATLGANVTLSGVWTDSAQDAYRAAFAGQVAAYVEGVDPTAEPFDILATAVSQIVRSGSALTQNATLFQLATESDTPLLEASKELGDGADAIIFLVPNVDEPLATGDQDHDTDEQALIDAMNTTYSTVAAVFAREGATVVAGEADTQADPLAVVRVSGTQLGTVDAPSTPLGSLNVVIALGYTLNGESVNFGTGVDAHSVTGAVKAAPKQQDEPATEQAPAEEVPASE